MPAVLIVDDDREYARHLGLYLSWHGYRVTDLADPTAVMERLESGEYDLLIASLFMKGESGLSLCGKISRSSSPGVRRTGIVMTWFEEPTVDILIFFNKNNIHFVLKFENTGQWLEKLDIILRERKAPHEKETLLT